MANKTNALQVTMPLFLFCMLSFLPLKRSAWNSGHTEKRHLLERSATYHLCRDALGIFLEGNSLSLGLFFLRILVFQLTLQAH